MVITSLWRVLNFSDAIFLIDGIAAVQNSPQLTATQIRAHNKMASSTNVQAKVEIIVLEGRPIE